MISSSSITSQTSHYVKPSVFDLVAQDSMSELIEPAFKKIVYYLSVKNPQKYGWLFQWSDKCFLGFNILLQKFCLVQCRASFSEFMYKLERVSSTGSRIGDNNRLPWKQEMLSLLCLTLIPHMKNKMKELPVGEERSQLLSKVFKGVLFLSSLSRLTHHLLYLSNKIESHSPLLTLSGVRLTYQQDDQIQSNRFLAYLSTLIQVGAFSVQLLQSWYSTGGDDVTIGGAGTIPPPPPPCKSRAVVVSDSCPLCKQRPRIATVLATSGYVFCFKCIAERLQSSPSCPVTGVASRIDDLIQIYAAAS